jgi:transcriptional regulator with XRE-family HTH domain
MNQKRLKQLKNGISERIKAILEEKDWYQQQLADGIGSNKSNISQILHGNVNLTLETIVALEEALGESIIQVTAKKK